MNIVVYSAMNMPNHMNPKDDVLDDAEVICVLKDAYGAFVYTNRQMERFFNAPTGGFIGKTDYHLMPDHDAMAIRANDKRVLETGEELEAVEIVHADGAPTYYLVNKFRLVNGEKRFLGVFGMRFPVENGDAVAAAEIAREKMKEQVVVLKTRLQTLAERLQ